LKRFNNLCCTQKPGIANCYTFLTFVPVLAITTAIWAALLTAIIWLALRLA
jgi:hypothetical protein